MIRIIVDPYMFDLREEKEIKENLCFFETLCYLIKNNRICVCVYKDLIDRLLNCSVKPFPVFLDKISDATLKEKLKSFNSVFTSIFLRNVAAVELADCAGEQDFSVISDSNTIREMIYNDERYIEMSFVLIQTCFNKDFPLDSSILTGDKSNGLKIGDKFSLKCKCSVQSLDVHYCLNSINSLLCEKDKAYIKLSEFFKNDMVNFIESPCIIRGDHHNFLQFNSNFNTYEGLSNKNKSVIKYLRYFGLYKIVFGEFHQNSKMTIGTIISHNIKSNDDCDLVEGWLYAETGYINHVDLYFPKNVGNCLMKYLDNEFSYNNIVRLYDILL